MDHKSATNRLALFTCLLWLSCIASFSNATAQDGADEKARAGGSQQVASEQVSDSNGDSNGDLGVDSSSLARDKQADDAIAYWVEQLGHDHYLRREIASQKLIAEGPAAVDMLALAVRGGDLEVVERATAAMVEIAVSNAPRQDGGAYDQLNGLASKTVGRAASRAASAMKEVRLNRVVQAKQSLEKAGISVGVKEFAIGAISQPRMLVQIDDQWNGDTDSLQWLAWLNDVQNARISGSAVTPEVMAGVTEIPGILSIAIVDADITDDAIEPLTKMERIDSLDFRYVQLTEAKATSFPTSLFAVRSI